MLDELDENIRRNRERIKRDRIERGLREIKYTDELERADYRYILIHQSMENREEIILHPENIDCNKEIKFLEEIKKDYREMEKILKDIEELPPNYINTHLDIQKDIQTLITSINIEISSMNALMNKNEAQATDLFYRSIQIRTEAEHSLNENITSILTGAI